MSDLAFTPHNWFWIVAADKKRFWSSAAGTYVDTLPEGAGVTRILNEQELCDVLAIHGLPGPLVLPANVEAEQRRRLAAGFDFDFGDARGVHHIATTEKDMQDWQEVTSWANARTARGDKVSTITIATASGFATITAPEWWSIVDAGTAARQPIFQGAFWLLAQDPVPPDYATNDAYWGG